MAVFFDRSVKIALDIKKQVGSDKLKDFKAALEQGPKNFPQLVALNQEVTAFARKFPTVGF